MLLIVLVFLPLLSLTGSANTDDFLDPNWIKPDPWSQHKHEQRKAHAAKLEDCKCPPIPICPPAPQVDTADRNNELAMIFYKKFVVRLLDESALIPDAGDSEILLRNLQLKIKREQLEELKSANTVRKIDGIISGIIEQSTDSVYHHIAESVCLTLMGYAQQISQNEIIRYLLLSLVGLPVLFYVVKFLSRLMHASPYIIVPALFLMIGLVTEFNECRNKQEIEAMARLYHADTDNPCQKLDVLQQGTFGFVNSWFSKDPRVECEKHLSEILGATRTTCDPSQLLIGMIAKLQMKYFESVFIKIYNIFEKITASRGYVETIIIAVFLIALVYIIVTNVIKYGIYGSFNFFGTWLTHAESSTMGRYDRGIIHADSRQSLPAAMPSINLNINIDKTRKKLSRTELNRIEELPPPNTSQALQLESKKLPEKSPQEDGSGDAPREVEASGSESESEVTQIHSQFPISVSSVGEIKMNAKDGTTAAL
ncbi:uncharacterized protein LOC129724117 [Wyeomyia smithii]|uniref:uncharacterized protein LOC129724117 n=1 Tax=Wyeomyia smithii TaxID=174621 RepID=UPI002467D45D|nr:uncharacterized protein LOC129724117 [Wyeomyia smithii]XP_055534742.1 uncharacterized protein LOC129724117 [Wyeomyia smithii]